VGWFWGGMTVQGILPYYYNIVGVPGGEAKALFRFLIVHYIIIITIVTCELSSLFLIISLPLL